MLVVLLVHLLLSTLLLTVLVSLLIVLVLSVSRLMDRLVVLMIPVPRTISVRVPSWCILVIVALIRLVLVRVPVNRLVDTLQWGVRRMSYRINLARLILSLLVLVTPLRTSRAPSDRWAPLVILV